MVIGYCKHLCCSSLIFNKHNISRFLVFKTPFVYFKGIYRRQTGNTTYSTNVLGELQKCGVLSAPTNSILKLNCKSTV